MRLLVSIGRRVRACFDKWHRHRCGTINSQVIRHYLDVLHSLCSGYLKIAARWELASYFRSGSARWDWIYDACLPYEPCVRRTTRTCHFIKDGNLPRVADSRCCRLTLALSIRETTCSRSRCRNRGFRTATLTWGRCPLLAADSTGRYNTLEVANEAKTANLLFRKSKRIDVEALSGRLHYSRVLVSYLIETIRP